MGVTSQKGKGDRGKRTSNHTQTSDLCSIAKFQPCEPRKPVEILCLLSLLALRGGAIYIVLDRVKMTSFWKRSAVVRKKIRLLCTHLTIYGYHIYSKTLTHNLFQNVGHLLLSLPTTHWEANAKQVSTTTFGK